MTRMRLLAVFVPVACSLTGSVYDIDCGHYVGRLVNEV